MKYFIYPSRIKKTNLGDILINILLIRELSNHGIVYLDGEINEVIDLVKTNNNNSSNIRIVDGQKGFYGLPVLRWINFINKLDDITMVFDPPGHYSEGKDKPKFILKSIKYLVRANILKILKIKVSRIGVTLGPFSENGWNYQKKISNAYHNISVRDSKNYDDVILKGLQNIRLIDDLAFLYRPQNFLNDYSPSNRDSKYIVISFRGVVEGSTIDYDYINLICAKLSYLIKLGEFSNYSFVYSYQVEEDLQVINYIIEKFQTLKLKFELLKDQLDFKAAIELYHNAEIVFTNRLHVALLAMLNNTPAIVITDLKKHHKLVDVYNDLGLSKFLFSCHSNDNLDKENLKSINELMASFKNTSFEKYKALKISIEEITNSN